MSQDSPKASVNDNANTPTNQQEALRKAALDYHQFPIPGKFCNSD
jgi:malate dehydrogenase (oxaloacetate-decarboxylating)(NADP+)